MKLPLPSTIRTSKVLPKLREYLVNLFSLGGNIISRPGVTTIQSVSGACRGIFEFSENLYALYGETLYRYDGASLVSVGTILGSQHIIVANGFNHAAICVPNGNNYTLTAPGTLQLIPDPDLPPCRDVDRLNGYFLWCPFNGDPIIYSDVGDASSIPPLNFFDAETLPDKNIGLVNFRNDLFVLGHESIERFRQIGPSTAPFVRVEGGSVPAGYLGGKIISKDNVFFIGRDQGQGPGFFSMVISGVASRISTPAIDEMLELDYTEGELKSCVSNRLQWRGADIYLFSLARHTFCYTNGNWSFWSSEVDERHVTPWAYTSVEYYNGIYYTGKLNSFGYISEDYTDEGVKFQRIVNTFARHPEGDTFSPSYLSMEIAQGISDAGSVGLSLSRDGKTWGDRFFIDFGDLGQYQRDIEWRYPGGLGSFGGYMGIEVYTTSDASFSVDNAVIGI